MARAHPILVYSIYAADIARFEKLLHQALPGVPIRTAGSMEQAKPHLHDTEILYGWGFPGELLRNLPALRWVQKMGAGVDDIVGCWPFGPEVILTRTDGRLIAPRMAEYVLGAILDHSIGFDRARELQRKCQWTYFEVGTIRNLTAGIAGLGEIGSMVAELLRGVGMRVVGWRRTAAPCGCVDEQFVGDGELPRFLSAADVVVLVLPLTKDTRRKFDAPMLAHCRAATHLINVGRGGVIDEEGLLGALAEGRVRRATLDVVAEEPLKPGHPFWDHPHVALTPHVCGPLVPEDVAPHFLANYKAFIEGKPMRNRVDLVRQY